MATYDLNPPDIRGIPWPFNVVDECLEEIVNEYETEYWQRYLEMTSDRLIEELDDILHDSDESIGSTQMTPSVLSLLLSEDERCSHDDLSSTTRTDVASPTYLEIYSLSDKADSDCSSLFSDSLVHLLSRLEDLGDISDGESEYQSLQSVASMFEKGDRNVIPPYIRSRSASHHLLDF